MSQLGLSVRTYANFKVAAVRLQQMIELTQLACGCVVVHQVELSICTLTIDGVLAGGMKMVVSQVIGVSTNGCGATRRDVHLDRGQSFKSSFIVFQLGTST